MKMRVIFVCLDFVLVIVKYLKHPVLFLRKNPPLQGRGIFAVHKLILLFKFRKLLKKYHLNLKAEKDGCWIIFKRPVNIFSEFKILKYGIILMTLHPRHRGVIILVRYLNGSDLTFTPHSSK